MEEKLLDSNVKAFENLVKGQRDKLEEIEKDFLNKYTYDAVGCKECNNSGYYDRIGIFEVLSLDDNIKELIVNGASSIEIRKEALNIY